jgi:hypothetical protein
VVRASHASGVAALFSDVDNRGPSARVELSVGMNGAFYAQAVILKEGPLASCVG